MNTHRDYRDALARLSAVARARLAGWLGLAEQGWHLFPIRPGCKAPPVFEDWRTHATTDPDKIIGYWTAHRWHNAGIACGPSALLVLDCDLPKRAGETGDGAANLAELATRAGVELPATYTVSTPSGGRHLYFKAPARHGDSPPLGNTNGSAAALLDSRGDGGYVLAPGSVLAPRTATTGRAGHPGGAYELLDDTDPAELPAWLHQHLSVNRSASLSAPPETAPALRHDLSAYVAAVVRAETQRVAQARPGTHNGAVFTAARALGQLVAGELLDQATVDAALADATASIIAGPCDCTTREITATIASGLAWGARRPRRLGGRTEVA